MALSRSIYEITSPLALTWHVALRKTYSVVAFALVGFCFRRALEERGARDPHFWRVVAGIALYSAAIEFAQWLHGSQEGLMWNTIDVACGALGGAIAVCDLPFKRRSIPAPQPR